MWEAVSFILKGVSLREAKIWKKYFEQVNWMNSKENYEIEINKQIKLKSSEITTNKGRAIATTNPLYWGLPDPIDKLYKFQAY